MVPLGSSRGAWTVADQPLLCPEGTEKLLEALGAADPRLLGRTQEQPLSQYKFKLERTQGPMTRQFFLGLEETRFSATEVL